MRLITKSFLISLVLCFGACQSKPIHNVLVDVVAMPPEPVWVEFSRKPIIEKKEKDFLVSDEFVEKALQQKNHLDRITKWKQENQIP